MRYGVAIARHLRGRGHQVFITTRKHPDTIAMAEFLGEKVMAVGEYNPESLLSRLESGVLRQMELCRIFREQDFDVAVSHGSPDLCRVAFGLGKPVITTVDTPYAYAVHKLTLPLSKYIVKSASIADDAVDKFVSDGEIVDFNSVDEVAWIQGFKPVVDYGFGRPLVVIRPLEDRAIYAQKQMDILQLAKNLSKRAKVVYLDRYRRENIDELIVPQGFVDSASLVAQADLFIGVGGTITREAALQGTPAIVLNAFEKQEVNDYLMERGFPIFKSEISGAQVLAEKLLGQRFDVKEKLAGLRNPLDVIADLVER
jgi:predicted glycosyltransferase